MTCQKFKYNFTHFKNCHMISAISYTVHSKDSLFNSLKNSCYKTQSCFERYLYTFKSYESSKLK